MLDDFKGDVIVNVPVKIGYPVLNKVLKEKAIGQKIGGSSDYAEIIDISVEASPLENYDLVAHLTLKTLTSILKNKEVSLSVHLQLDYDKSGQVIHVTDYKLDSESTNWIVNNLLETIVNSLLYNKVKDQMSFDITPHIKEQLTEINKKLSNSFTTADGLLVHGDLKELSIYDILANKEGVLIFLFAEAKAAVEVKSIQL